MKEKSMMRVIPLFMSLNMLLSACAGASQNSQINVLTGSAAPIQQTGPEQTSALPVQTYLKQFAVDKARVYAAGYSAGGETMSQAVSMRPDLYAAYLHGASQWDGTYAPVAQNRVSVYIFMAENDEYYGSQKARDAYNGLLDAYRETGLSDEEINRFLQIEIPDNEYFNRQGIYHYHGGGNILFDDETILNWIIEKEKKGNCFPCLPAGSRRSLLHKVSSRNLLRRKARRLMVSFRLPPVRCRERIRTASAAISAFLTHRLPSGLFRQRMWSRGRGFWQRTAMAPSLCRAASPGLTVKVIRPELIITAII